jgi:hypothetical protein
MKTQKCGTTLSLSLVASGAYCRCNESKLLLGALASNNPGHRLKRIRANVEDLAKVIESTLHIGLPALAN